MDNYLLIKEIKQYLNDNLNNIVNDVVLFGSKLRNSNTSDYDILIVLNKEYDNELRKKIGNLCYDIELKYDIIIDNQIISKHELENSLRGKHPVYQYAILEGIHA